MQPSELERELRAALAGKAGRAAVSPGAWDQVQRRIRRQRLGRAGIVALALGVLLVAVLAVPLARTLLPGRAPVPPATAPPPPGPPPRTTPARPILGAVADPAAALRAIGRQPRGAPSAAVSWTDANGDNLLVLSHADVTGESELLPGQQSVTTTLWAELLATRDGRTTVLRTVTDSFKDCAFDRETRFSEARPEVTDLDGDGVGEVLFSYTVGCRSDVSEVDVKLLALEGTGKYIIRGKTYLTAAEGSPRLADGVPEPAYAQWPSALAQLARQRYAERVNRG